MLKLLLMTLVLFFAISLIIFPLGYHRYDEDTLSVGNPNSLAHDQIGFSVDNGKLLFTLIANRDGSIIYNGWASREYSAEVVEVINNWFINQSVPVMTRCELLQNAHGEMGNVYKSVNYTGIDILTDNSKAHEISITNALAKLEEQWCTE